jgi:predicted secreted hydrolase
MKSKSGAGWQPAADWQSAHKPLTRAFAGLLTALTLLASTADPYRTALPGYHFEFPRDHFSHPDFQTEWWYYTGNVHTRDGRRFGFELTFFRHSVDRSPATTVWDVRNAWLAHLALSDIDGKRFFHTQRLNRSGVGLAGADLEQRRVWNGNWFVQWGDKDQKLEAIADRFLVDLTLEPVKPPVIHGENGVSQKAAGAGHASHYISFTRLATRGAITVDGTTYQVEGLTWMDHEFFTHQLEANQTGWDWFSVQLDDGSELMLFRLRRKDGSVDPYSAGTYVDPRGRTEHILVREFAVTPGAIWTSPETHGRYPIAWSIDVPPLDLHLALKTDLPQQELTGRGMNYWEGAIAVSGTKQGRAVKGVGYLEMTGYAGPVQMD